MRATRWSDNDHYFGPLTYAYTKDYRPLALVLSSVDDEEWDYHGRRRSTLRWSAFGHTLILSLPMVVPPYKEKVYPGSWDEATIKRLGRDWYWKIDKREFGFSYQDGFLQTFRGRHTMDSMTDRTKSYFLPWTRWRHVRRSFYDLEGKHFWSEIEAETQAVNKLGANVRMERLDIVRKWEEMCPKAVFRFQDHDGKELQATTHIEEREWRFGTGYFKWLSLFRRPKICRSLCLNFSGETGPEKGSWKGGTICTSIDMLPGELHEAAFRRYCDEDHRSKYRKYKVKFGGAA